MNDNFKMINIDGPDGVGKTSIIEGLMQYYGLLDTKYQYIHFPRYNTDIGSLIRESLFNRTAMDPKSLQMLYSADRLNFTRFDLPQIKKDCDMLFVDRYLTSGVVFGQVDGLRPEDILVFDRESEAPTINIILLAKPEYLMKRLLSQNRPLDRYENIVNQTKAFEGYINLDRYVKNVRFINAEKDLASVLNNVLQVVEEHINN